MPHATVEKGQNGNPVYQVGGKSFVFFRTPRPDAIDPHAGERYDDVIVIWVQSEADNRRWCKTFPPRSSLRHTSRAIAPCLCGQLGLTELDRQELAEIIEEAWLSRASPRGGQEWLKSRASE